VLQGPALSFCPVEWVGRRVYGDHPYGNPVIETCGVHRVGTSPLSVRRGLFCGGSSLSALGPLLMSGLYECCMLVQRTHIAHTLLARGRQIS
jgi:hypothetical protein